jgi:hypothetical protein
MKSFRLSLTFAFIARDFKTEIEHGFTDKLQASLSIEQRYINNHGVNGDRDALDDTDAYRFGGIAASTKYRLSSPFKDPWGVALRLEGGYLWHDEVDGLDEHSPFIAPEVDLQKTFLEDTLITELGSARNGAGANGRPSNIPSNWRFKAARVFPIALCRTGSSAWKHMCAPSTRCSTSIISNMVVYAGPSIHYSSQRWWATLTYNYQVWGNGVDEPADGKTYAEETTHQVRLKVGFNF